MTTRLACVLLLTSLVACGDDGNNTPTDGAGSGSGSGSGSNVPAMITVMGKAQSNNGSSTMPLSGVMIGAYANSDENTPVATTTSDTSGNYTLTITTNGHALDGYIKATIPTYLDTYLYPPAPLAADFSGASLNIITSSTYGLVSTLCQGNQLDTNGGVAAEVVDAAMMPVAGATVSATPAASKYCYNSGGSPSLPSGSATATAVDGLSYMFNLTGDATVSATKSGTTFRSHALKARAGALTTTLIQAQ